MVLERYYRKWDNVPRTVKIFLAKGFALFLAWKLVYLLLLQPARIIDEPLTTFTADGTITILNHTMQPAGFTTKAVVDEYNADGELELQPASAIFYNNERVLSIADICNALELIVLYIGFIICFPAAIKRKILFITGGSIFICFVNMLRCAGLTWVFIRHPQYGDFSHHYLFTFIVYACIFLLWFWFTKNAYSNAKA